MNKKAKILTLISISIILMSCDGLFVNKSPSYLYDLDLKCIDTSKIDSLNKAFIIDTLNNYAIRENAKTLMSGYEVKKVFSFKDPDELIAFNDVWDIQNVINNKISNDVIFNKNIPKSEILRIGKRIEDALLHENCTKNVNNSLDYEEEVFFYKINTTCISPEFVNYLNGNHSINLIKDSLIKNRSLYFKYLAESNHVYFFEHPDELIALSSDYKRIIYYYSKTLKSFKDSTGEYIYNYSEKVSNKIIIFPAGYQLKLSEDEKQRIGRRIQEIQDNYPCRK